MNEDELLKTFKKEGVDFFKGLDQEFKTEILCIEALKSNFEDAILYVPQHILTDELLSRFIKSKKKAEETLVSIRRGLMFIPNKYKTKEFCTKAISINHNNTKFIPLHYFSDVEFVEKIIKTNPSSIAYVPNQYKTLELCKYAFNLNPDTLRYFPDDTNLSDFYKAYVQRSMSISLIPEDLIDTELLVLGFLSKTHRQDRLYINSLPNKHITEEFLLAILKHNENYLKRFFDIYDSKGLVSKDGAKKMVNVNSKSKKYIPKEFLK